MRRTSVMGFLTLLVGIFHGAFPEIVRCQSAVVTIEELARQAEVVVVGKVTEVKSEWSADRSRIYSNVTLQVDEHIKGDNTQRSVVIATLGGEIDGVGELYSHTARFKADEQVVVFAAADRQGQLRVVGGDEGKLTVTRDEVTGLRVVADSVPLPAFTARLKSIVEAQSHHE